MDIGSDQSLAPAAAGGQRPQVQSPAQAIAAIATSVPSRQPRAAAPPPGSWCNLTRQIDAAIAAHASSQGDAVNATLHLPPLVNAQPVCISAQPVAALPAAVAASALSNKLSATQPVAKSKRFAKRVHKQPAQPQPPFVRPTIYSTDNPAPGVDEANLSVTHGDCVEGMKRLASTSVDLVIADPPYDIGVGKAAWDSVPHYMQWSRTWLAEAVRVLKPGGALMLYGSPERLWISRLKIMCADEFGLDFKQHISWVYKQGGDSRMNNMVKYAVRMEHLEWFVKPGAEHTFNLDAGTEAYTEAEFMEALAKGVGRVTPESLSRGKPPKNWWDIPRENSRSKEREYGSHPSMKPLRICNRIVGIHSNEGDTVLVPFGGSGSECIAVGAAGRKLVAYEQQAEYHRIIVRRMKGWGLLSGPPSPPPPEQPAEQPAAAGGPEDSDGMLPAAEPLLATAPLPISAQIVGSTAAPGATATIPHGPQVLLPPSALPAATAPPAATPAAPVNAMASVAQTPVALPQLAPGTLSLPVGGAGRAAAAAAPAASSASMLIPTGLSAAAPAAAVPPTQSMVATLAATASQPVLLSSLKRPRTDDDGAPPPLLGVTGSPPLGLPVVMASGPAMPMHAGLPIAAPLVPLAAWIELKATDA